MQTSEELADLLRVLGDPTRLRLLAGLGHGELAVSEITQVTGLSQPRVSRHLKLLCEARVLQRTRDQNEVYYRAALDEDRRARVNAALASLPEDDPVIARDQERLTAILDSRQVHARALLSQMGIRPLSPEDRDEVRNAVYNLLADVLPENEEGTQLGDLLDIGTGTGSMLRLLARRARRTVAVDRSREMRLVARATVLSQALANCTVQEGDMYSLSFQEGHFDIVAMDRVLGAAENPAAGMREAARVIKPGGHLLVVETAGSPADEEALGKWIRGAGLRPLDVRQTATGAALVALAARDPKAHSQAA